MFRTSLILRVLTVAALSGAIVWATVLAVGGGQPGPQQAGAAAPVASTGDVIDSAVAQVDASMSGALGAESNPYRIAQSAPALDRVVALGTPAIREIAHRIERSPSGGLDEYLLAICANRIMKANIAGRPGSDTYWDTPKQYPEILRRWVASIPASVTAITSSGQSNERKNAQLEALGTPAIPFILDEVAKGHSEVADSAKSLMDGTVEMRGESPRGIPSPQWAAKQAERFGELRSLSARLRERTRPRTLARLLLPRVVRYRAP